MARTLLLDCYLGEAGGTPNFLPALRSHDVHSVRVIREPVPTDLSVYDAVVVTGSAASVSEPPSWLDGLEQLVRDCGRDRIPLLGVCFGHQVIASALYGRDAVYTRPRIEVGWKQIAPCTPDPVFAGLEQGFCSFVSHYDEVRSDLEGPLWTARSEDCPTHGLRIPDLPMWGIQFHAEMPVEEATHLIRTRSLTKPEHYPDPEGTLAGAVATPETFEQIVRNFFAASQGSP